MCEPFTISLMVASAATAAYGQYQQGQAQKGAADYNSKLQKYNAGVQDGQSADAIARGEVAAGRSLEGTARQVGEGTAAFAGAGVDVGVGAPVLWQADALGAGYQDAALIQYNSQQEARGFQGQAFNSRAGAQLSRSSGRNSRTAGNIAAGTSLLAGASQIAGRYP